MSDVTAERRTTVLSTPLGHKIPVGKCEVSMDAKEMQKKIEENEKFSRYLNGFLERLDQRITDQSKNITRIERLSEKNSELLQDLIAKTKNGWGETLARHDAEIKTRVTRDEFNAAMNSIRAENKSAFNGIERQIDTLKWIFALGMTAIAGLIAAGYFLGG